MIIFLTIINRDSFYPKKELSPNGLKFNGQNSITWIKFKILTFVSELLRSDIFWSINSSLKQMLPKK